MPDDETKARRKRASKLAKRHGYEWEVEVGEGFGMRRMPAGPGTDVEGPMWDGLSVIECKSQMTYAGLTKLVKWLRQAEKYTDKWMLAIKLGQRNQRIRVVVMPYERAINLIKLERSVYELGFGAVVADWPVASGEG